MARKKILVVDDEPNIHYLLTRVLEKDYELFHAKNGREAIEAAEKYRPDLILLDIMMPEVDGYTACSAIKSNPSTSEIPIIMLTGVDFQLNRELAARVGAKDYLTKPFTPEGLKKTVGRFLPAAEGPDGSQ